jgi:hypothetical protein
MTRPLNGQVIGQAHAATRAVLERMLASTGTSFESWLLLNQIGSAAAAAEEGEVVRAVAHGLKADEQVVRAALAALVDADLVEHVPAGPTLALTPAGAERFQRIGAGIAAITERLYGDLPAEDLATAGRVLGAVTDRANQELASS